MSRGHPRGASSGTGRVVEVGFGHASFPGIVLLKFRVSAALQPQAASPPHGHQERRARRLAALGTLALALHRVTQLSSCDRAVTSANRGAAYASVTTPARFASVGNRIPTT